MLEKDKTTFNKKIKSKNLVWHNETLWLDPNSVDGSNEGFYSLDLEWEPMPDANTYAVVMLDYEASRVIGQNFVHWSVANLTDHKLPYKASVDHKHSLVQGINSRCPAQSETSEKGVIIECIPSAFKAKDHKEATGYLPPMPPDKPHLYQIRVYGLDKTLPLKNSFFLGELFNEMHGHIVGTHVVHFWSNGGKK